MQVKGFSSVCVRLFLQSAGIGARVVAVCAVERLFSSVLAHVSSEFSSCCARIVALVTIERLFSRMSEYMSLKDTSLYT